MFSEPNQTNTGNTTAIISILTRDHLHHEAFKRSPIHYKISLSFGGNTVLPPFLPRMHSEGILEVRKTILSELEQLRKLTPTLNQVIVPDDDGETITEKIKDIGRMVANYLPEFKEVLKALPDMEVGNVIIYTNDFSIPWLWAYYINNPRLSKEEDFLMSRYPCGLLIVDADEKGAMNRINHFRANYLQQRKTDALLLKELDVSFFMGNLKEATTAQDKNPFFLNYNQIFSKRFEEDVHLISDLSAKGNRVQRKRLLNAFSHHIDCSKIIHYTGEMSHEEIRFNSHHKLTKDDIDHLSNFDYQPLLVMHGYTTGGYKDLEKIDRPLPTVFLEKGASGCLMATLPVDKPLEKINDNATTLLRIFYRHLMEMKPYGKALFDSIKEFQNIPENKNNPSWLFYKFYGDPRGRLMNSDGNAWLDRLASAQQVEELKLRKKQKQNLSNQIYTAVSNHHHDQDNSKKSKGPKVFISYAREDAGQARTIYAQMEKGGLKPWMDEFDLPLGARWRNEVSRVIQRTDYVIVAISKQSLEKNGNYKSEIAQALAVAEKLDDTQCKIVPLVLDESEIPIDLQIYNGFYLRDRPIDFLVKGLLKGKESELS